MMILCITQFYIRSLVDLKQWGRLFTNIHFILLFFFLTLIFFHVFQKINFSFDFFIGILSVYYFLPVFWTSYHPYLMISRKSSKKKPMFTREICKHWDEIHWYKCEWNLICPKNKFCILNCNCIIILNPRLFYQK